MKKILLPFFLLHSLTCQADNMQINISSEQIDKLGINIGPLSTSRQIPLFYAPAKVVLPANHEILISSTQPGLLMQLKANIGDTIRKNQILAQINSPELVNLQREYLTAAAELELSQQEFERDNKLLQEGVIPDRRWHETQAKHNNKSAQFDSLRQLLIMAGMSTAELNNLTKTHQLNSLLNIRSPIDGVILERNATLGSRLDIQAPIYKIADLSELWLEINIPQERTQEIHIGDQVKVENQAVTAKINLLGQSVSRDNQTVLARAVITTKSEGLRVGQNLNTQIMQGSPENGYRVNNTAIAQNDGHNYIFIRNSNGFLVKEVKILGKQNSESLISAPLSGNEQIAVRGAVALKANWLGLGAE